jgi:hypothetical protein
MLLLLNKIIEEKEQDSIFINNKLNKRIFYGKYFKNINEEELFYEYSLKIFNLLKKAKDKRHKLIFALKEYYEYKLNKEYLSNFHIEVDQSSSGPQIYALLSHDKKMGFITNLIGNKKKQKQDIYIDFLKSFKKDLRSFCDNNNNIIGIKQFKKKINNIFTRANFGKLIIMPKFYNMGDKGTKELLDSLALPVYKELNLKEAIVNIINKILNKKYNNTIAYQKFLVDIAKVLFDNKVQINIKLIDGSFIKYKYIKIKENFGKIYKSNKKSISYRIYLPLEDELEDNNKNSLDVKHYTTFPPNFIHSLDGALCRIIVSFFYKLFNIVLEPLHDSFRIPLILYDNLQVVIKYIYIYVFFTKYFYKNKISLKENNKIENNKILEYNKSTHILNESRKVYPSYEIEYNSINFNKFLSYLPQYNSTDIIMDTLIHRLNENEDICIVIKDKIEALNDKYKKNMETDNIIKNIIDSEFMFYF